QGVLFGAPLGVGGRKSVHQHGVTGRHFQFRMVTAGVRVAWPGTAKQARGVAAVASSRTLEGAARRIGVNASTLRRWRELPAFQEAERQARQRILDETLTGIVAMQRKALAALARNLESGTPAAEIRAAELIVNLALKLTETVDLARRVEAMEQRAAAPSRNG